MIAGPLTVVRSSRAPGFNHHTSVDLRVDQVALDPLLDRVQHETVGGQDVVQSAGVLPPAMDDVRLDPQTAVDEMLDGVGDLSSPRAEGSIARAAACTAGVNMYTPTRARLVWDPRASRPAA